MAWQAILVWLIVGGVAGWLAGLVMKGGSMGLVGNVVVGIVGAAIAGWLFPVLGLVLGGGILGAVLHAFVGAVILLFILRLVPR
jgi:uncharacterized membrane protein YeaQ/YmgE (transglycosylase-associated protein family)